jgi:hypothetical protein
LAVLSLSLAGPHLYIFPTGLSIAYVPQAGTAGAVSIATISEKWPGLKLKYLPTET